ncbi:MAG: hypothetical protein PHQ43_08325 [Dehalococcoidales bacterium]|nr:hypothetical protein [Dehalococcoidales bacterium]
MSTTLAQYKFLGPDAEVRAGIAKTIITTSELLRTLPFVQLSDNNITRTKMELTSGGADTYEVAETWQESPPTWEYRDHPLAILGGDADVDNFGNLAAGEDVMASVIELKSKAVADWFEELAILGQTTAVAKYSAAKNFKGLIRLLCECETTSANTGATDLDGSLYYLPGTGNNAQVLCAASGASAVLTLDMIDHLISAVKPKATHLIMNWMGIQKISSLARAAGNNLTHDRDELGYMVTRYGDIQIIRDDFIPTNFPDPSSLVFAPASYTPTTTYAAGNDTFPIFAARLGEDGLCGINGEGMIQIEKFEKLETKDAKRTRIKFYAGLSLRSKRALAGLFGAALT